jgi:hypothetical protein
MTRIFNHRIKRIIDHRTYNTETATMIAGSADRALFKTRGRGDYFVAARWREMDEYSPEEHLGIQPLTPEQANLWLKEHFPGLRCEVLKISSPESRFTLRMPKDLRLSMDTLAKHRGQSVNAWIVRWLETGVSVEEEGTQHLGELKENADERRTRP